MHKSIKAPVPETLVIPRIFASTHPTICKQKEWFAKKIWDLSVVKINENHLMLKDESLNREKKNRHLSIKFDSKASILSIPIGQGGWIKWVYFLLIPISKCAYAWQDKDLTSSQKPSFTIVSYPFSLLLLTSRTPITYKRQCYM